MVFELLPLTNKKMKKKKIVFLLFSSSTPDFNFFNMLEDMDV